MIVQNTALMFRESASFLSRCIVGFPLVFCTLSGHSGVFLPIWMLCRCVWSGWHLSSWIGFRRSRLYSGCFLKRVCRFCSVVWIIWSGSGIVDLLDRGGKCLGDGFDCTLTVVFVESINERLVDAFHDSSMCEKRNSNNLSRLKQQHFSNSMRQP